MATILISAHECEFGESGPGSMSYWPMGRPIFRSRIEASKADYVSEFMRNVRAQLSCAEPQRSFFVSATVLSGRKPNGFDRVPRFDYDAKPLIEAVDNAAAELGFTPSPSKDAAFAERSLRAGMPIP